MADNYNQDNLRILITGATGFLGSHILKALFALGNYELIVLKRSFSDCWRITSLLKDDIAFVNVDENCWENKIGPKIDLIIHTATEYGRNGKHVTEILDTNLIFPLKLIELCIPLGLKHFINTDSYFNKTNFSYSTLLDYSLSKKSLNIWLKYHSSRIRISNMRLEHMYGEGDDQSKFVIKILNGISKNENTVLELTNGEQRRDFIHVSDVVNAFLVVINSFNKTTYRFKTFEVGTGSSTSIRDFVELVKINCKSNIILNFGAIPARRDEIMDSYADISELVDLGWQDKIDLHEGINMLINYYETQE